MRHLLNEACMWRSQLRVVLGVQLTKAAASSVVQRRCRSAESVRLH